MSPSASPSRLRLSPASRSSRLRTAIAGLCLVAQTFALVHLFAVRHVHCAEHGEMVHVDGAGRAAGGAQAGDAGHAARLERAPDAAAAISGSGLAALAHQDDHCMALSERRDLRTDAVTQVASSPQVMGELRYCHREPLLVVRPIYRLAPKISPPALA